MITNALYFDSNSWSTTPAEDQINVITVENRNRNLNFYPCIDVVLDTYKCTLLKGN